MSGPAPVALADFRRRLQGHDWHYNMSDDPGVWRRGSAVEQELLAIAKTSPQHRKLFDAFYDHAMGRGPAPELPADAAAKKIGGAA